MDNNQEIKNLISEAKNIYVIPQESSNEAISSALALFYTLKQEGKNVNLLIDNFPEKLMFLLPSLDFVSYPRNFVLSIPNQASNVSQIYYEKSDDFLKIHLTLDKGILKKDNISFYYSDIKPDLIVCVGIKNFKEQLIEKMEPFGFLIDTPVLNIDNSQNNLKFGKINIIEEKSLSEIILNVAELVSNPGIKKETANCLLSGLMIFSGNFTSSKTNSDILEKASFLIKQGADREKITKELFEIKPKENHKEIVKTILAKLTQQNLEINKENILKHLEN